MKLKSICAICCIATVATVANAQDKFIKYKGAIKTAPQPLALAGDSLGRLYYGTFDGTKSHVRIIEDPIAAIGGTSDAGTTIVNMASKITAATGRGVQGLQVASDNTLFVSGDTGSPTLGNLWKFNYTPGTPPTFTEDTAFTANVISTRASRRSGVAIVSEAGAGLLATSGFDTVTLQKSLLDCFDFSGNAVGTRLAADPFYYREIQYNSVDNVLYPIRNGIGSNNMIDSYVRNINPVTGNGTHVVSTLIDDGASNGASGTSGQQGYYYTAQNQLITMDGVVTQATLPAVRVWDINDNGTSLSLAYRIDGISPTEKFQSISDAVVINNHLYVDSGTSTSIFVFEVPPASVNRWNQYESTK